MSASHASSFPSYMQPAANVSASTSAAASPAALKVLTALLCALFGLSGYDSGSQVRVLQDTRISTKNPTRIFPASYVFEFVDLLFFSNLSRSFRPRLVLCGHVFSATPLHFCRQYLCDWCLFLLLFL